MVSSSRRVVALLPMKGNSERVRGKNFRSFNGRPVQDLNSLRIRVSEVAPGSSATLTVNSM